MCILSRYQRGNRCLVTNLTAPVQNVNSNKVTMEPEVTNYDKMNITTSHIHTEGGRL